MFEKKAQLACLYKVLLAAQSLGCWLKGYERGVSTGTLFRGQTATEGPETEVQADNQLETPRG